jgi:hypothetical protein
MSRALVITIGRYCKGCGGKIIQEVLELEVTWAEFLGHSGLGHEVIGAEALEQEE